MPQPYSADLRERVLVAYEQEKAVRWLSPAAFARPATVCNWIRQARHEGRRSPKPHRGGPAGMLGSTEHALLQALVAEVNDARWTSMPSACSRSRASASAARDAPHAPAPQAASEKKTLRAAEQDRPEIAAEREADPSR